MSIRAVADRVGKTPPSIYLHFADKDELMLSVCERSFAELGGRFAQVCEGIDDPVERLQACAKAYVHFALEHPEQYRIVFMANDIPKDEASFEALRGNVAFAPIYEAIEEAFERGQFSLSDPVTASLVMWAGVHGLSSLLIAKPSFPWPDVDELVSASCRQQLQGLCPR